MSDIDPSDAEPTGAPAANPAARIARASVMLSAIVERFDGPPTKHRVRDLSAGGIRIDQAHGLRVGATVLISVGVLEAVGATVKWVADDSAGLSFAQQIDPDHARMRAAIAPAAPASRAPVRPTSAKPRSGWVADLRDPYAK